MEQKKNQVVYSEKEEPIKTKKKRNTKGVMKKVGTMFLSLGAIVLAIMKSKEGKK